ncbi:hypothetical protein B7463_g5544, partial [Scytalidium lignicola]
MRSFLTMADVYGETARPDTYLTAAPTIMTSSLSSIAGEILQGPISFSYTGIVDLLNWIDNTANDSLTIRGVSRTEYKKIYSRSESRGGFNVSMYIADAKLLIITIPKGGHERVHGLLDDHILVRVVNMNLVYDWDRVGATTYCRMNNAGNIDTAGEGDSARKPLSQRPGGNDFPTLVIEGGYSQSLASLRAKARWWFTTSNHHVKVVLIAKVYKDNGNIVIELWKELPIQRQGAMTTRASVVASMSPQCIHTINISRANGIVPGHANIYLPGSYNVGNAPLRLLFTDLFLRNPVGTEGDIILSAANLQQFAAMVWRSILG